jgi:release factor glutamine methyltransferase
VTLDPLYQALAQARARLTDAGISEADASVDVDLYARTILGWDKARLLIEQQHPAPDALEPTFSEWVARRALREPTAYIIGHREFWGRDFTVTPAVLIPRPETEAIVDEAIARARALAAPRMADIGTGSGCIAVALALELPQAQFVATDVSEDALAIARGNASRYRVADRIEFIRTSYLDGVPPGFDIITANPPYVRDGDKPGLSRDVRHEPDIALFGGAQGLRDIAGVLSAASAGLRPGGWLIMEFGYGQEPDVEAMIDAQRTLRLDRMQPDLQGIPRTAIIQRP